MKHSFVPRVIVLAVFALAGPCAVAADSMTKVYVNDGETYELDVAGTANTANNATVHGSYTYYGVNLVLGTGCTVKRGGRWFRLHAERRRLLSQRQLHGRRL